MERAKSLRRLIVVLVVAVCMLTSWLPAARIAMAATYRTWVAQVPALPTNTNTVRVWMNSDTVSGETAGVEYKIGTVYTKVLGAYDTSFSGANWRADIPAQVNGITVEYQLFTRNQSGDDYGFTGFNWAYTVGGARALFVDKDTIAWNNPTSFSPTYKLLFDPDGSMDFATAGSTTCPAIPTAPCNLALTINGTVNGANFPKNPNAGGLTQLELPGGTADSTIKTLLKGQLLVASYVSSTMQNAARVQIQAALDALYATNAKTLTMGVTYSGGSPSVKVWAPTAKSVGIRKYEDSSTGTYTTHTLTEDAASGVWSIAGAADWNRDFYLFDVEVYVPSLDQVVHNAVTDPYSVSLSQDGSALGDVRSQFVDLADLTQADITPTDWGTLPKPDLAAPEDIVVYEVHIRDFSINDSTVASADRGTYKAFTYDGAGPHPNATLSDGMSHLKQLQQAGLTHIHLLPTFDIASVIEPAGQRIEPSINPSDPRNSSNQQTAVGVARNTDGFNWGYDPFHYGVPEGSYATNPDGITRIFEFRDMVSALNRNGLRVVMDVVYNHTAASGQGDKSVLDKVVPGYYYRYNTNGTLYTTSCCDDTATEYEMMEKLMIDTVVRFATAYKVDGFRFDLMNFHSRQNMVNLKTTVQALTVGANGVDGSKIYLYGEGWDFGSAKDKGLTTCPNCYAQKYNMTGSGIGAFNDIIRDAAHGGYSEDTTGIRKQGFINGLSYDWNGYSYSNRDQSDLWVATDKLRSALRGSGTTWNGQGTPFTDDPQEAVNYVEKHDNETLFDQNVFKLPNGSGSGNPGWIGSGIPITSMADRVRSQNMGISIIGLAQGIPFIQMGSDILRSKSLDRNSYDSGDWFNKVYWDKSSNNFGKGLPPTWDNNGRWGIMGPLLANTALDPTTADMNSAAAHMREIVRIRKSSLLFRLPTEAEINARTSHYNTANTQDAFIVMRLSDETGSDLDANYENILVFFNANKMAQSITIDGANGFSLHPIQADAIDADPVVQSATFNDTSDIFTIPARTTAVFVSAQALTPPASPSTLDWVGKLYPRGGVANSVEQGAFAPTGFDVYVRVYEAGVTEPAGQGAGIACYLHWGPYGGTWNDIAMTFNVQQGNDDEYKGTIPQATLNALGPGTYGFSAYCKKTAESGLKWKSDSYDIGGVGSDDDQGDGLITVIPSADPKPAPPGGVFVHLFEWRWPDIEKECTYLAQKGYSAVQVSPPNEHVVPTANQGGNTAAQYPWWVRYQPVTHAIGTFTSRSGTWAEFQSMVNTCNSLGVAIYVDAVINHMADIEVPAGVGTGTSGTQYDANPAAGRYYGTQYQADDFHTDCTTSDYGDRAQVQSCKLSGLPDLHTGKSDVQMELRGYLQALINAGVKGFRVDGAKHMSAQDIAAIFNGLTGTFYVFQEVIDQSSSERVRDWEYAPNGDVTEFAYAFALGAAFDDACGGSLSDLQNRFSQSDMLPNRFAQVFTDNHDNQRGHGVGAGCVVDHRDGQEHVLANIFALAYPYGYPSVMSSFYWQSSSTVNTGDSMGPPSTNNGGTTWGVGLGPVTRPVYDAGQVAGNVPANCSNTFVDGKWACEHRRTSTANMVRFRWVTAGESVNNWQNIGGSPSDHIAFGLGSKGFVAINRTGASASTTYVTAMPEGVYCDITKFDFIPNTGKCVVPGTTTDASPGDLVTVDASSQIVNRTLASMDAFAIHAGARMDTDYGTLGNSYGLPWHTQVTGQPILGPVWRMDDGVTRNSWAATGSVNLTVTGATGYVTGWFDWNQDGDFADDYELAFANEEVSTGPAKTKTFTRQTWTYTQPLNARFRVYSAPQTARALAAVAAPDAAPQPTGGVAGGEAEDYSWTFNPLAVTLADFSAVQQGNAVLLTWETNSELNNRGFNLYRGVTAAGPDRQLNETLIPSQSQGNPGGFVYTWEDRAGLVPGTSYFYWVEDVDIYGTAAMHGPVSVDFAVPTAVTLNGVQASSAAASSPVVAVVLALLASLVGTLVLLLRKRKETTSIHRFIRLSQTR